MNIDGAVAIRELLRPYPKLPLMASPCPLAEMEGLSAQLGSRRRAWVLRDDLTGFALGGNKIRKLEYLLGDALSRHVDTLVVEGATSFSRNAAAAGKAHGLDIHVVVAGDEAAQNPLSREYFKAMGAKSHYVADNDDIPARQRDLVEVLRGEGRNVQVLHPGGSDPIGTLGYIAAFAEIIEHMGREAVAFDQIFHATGSAATQAGLVLGQAISGCRQMRIVGIAISKPAEVQRRRVADLAGATAAMLGIDFDASAVIVDDRYLGDGYPIPSADSQAAVDLLAKAEGLVLDPIYAGKAAAALIGYARSGEFAETANVLLIHTGGNGGAYY